MDTLKTPDFVQDLGHGVFAVDTGFHRPRFDAAYLVVHGDRAAFIDTGTTHAVPRLLAALETLGLSRDAVEWVVPTHVHLDHAGGVGLLMQELPLARLLVHPRGARHMIDPRQLWQGATAVYGPEEMARSYGELQPVPVERVQSSVEGQVFEVGGRALHIAHTPGHAQHHHCIWDPLSRGWFTGDTMGLSYREFDVRGRAWIMPTTTPVQFDPDALRTSIARLLALQPQCLYLTHFGRVDDVPRLGAQLLDQLDQLVALGLALRDHPQRHDALKQGLLQLLLDSLRAQGCELPQQQIADLLAMDLELNAQGMGIWLNRR